jgi:hypothetical protein
VTARAGRLLLAGALAALLAAAGGGGGEVAERDGGAADGAVGDGGEEGPEKINVTVDGTAELRLGFVCIESRCDDKEVVRVEDGGDHLKLRGLKEGRTRCGFWKEQNPKPHRLFEVTVTSKPPKPPKR